MKKIYWIVPIVALIGATILLRMWENDISMQGSEVSKDTQVKEYRKESSKMKKIDITKLDNVGTSIIKQSSTSPIQKNEEKGFSSELKEKRELAIQRRKERMAERKRYQIARHKWRRALNKARKEAQVTGNYEKYEALKMAEPDKSF